MKKIVKILSVFIAVLLIVLPFISTASANTVDDALWFLLEWTVNNASYVFDDDKSAQDIVDYASTPSGAAFIALATAMGSGVGNLNNPVVGLDGNVYKRNPVRVMTDVAGNIGAAKAGEYQVARVSQDFVNRATAALNGMCGISEIRNLSLSDLGLTTYGNVQSGWGYYESVNVNGSNYPCLQYNNSTSYLKFIQDGVRENTLDKTTVYVFNGDGNYPPVIHAPSGNLIYQDGIALPGGTYIVLNGSELYSVGSGSHIILKYWSGSTVDDIKVMVNTYDHDHWSGLYRNGQLYYPAGGYDDVITGYDLLDKLVKSVGIILDVGDYTVPDTFTAPDITPFADDNGYVICLCPCDNPGQVVYMSDDTYNNYVNDGTIVNDNSITNNIVDDETIENFSTIINNYNTNVTSSYDDSNLISKLSGWFGDVNNNLRNIVDRLDTLIDTVDNFSKEPVYANFSDCLFKNVPAMNQIQTSFKELQTDDFDPLNFTFNFSAFGINDYTFFIDFSWYEPYRVRVREILKIGAYIIGIGAWWRAFCSVFGIH